METEKPKRKRKRIRKPKKPNIIEIARANMGKVIASILTMFALVGGFYKLQDHVVTRPIHDLSLKVLKQNVDSDLAQLANTIEKIQETQVRIQKDSAIKSAEDQLFFWQRSEMELKSVKMKLGRSPSPEFEEKLQESIQQRKEAKDRLDKLRELK